MSKHVFISHSSVDKNFADAICHALEQKNVPCWIAPRDVPHGADWSSTIVKAIKDAKLVLLVFSKNANESDFVYREIERAAHHQCPILPVRLEDVLPNERLELFLGVSHWLNAMDTPFRKELDRIVQGVRHAMDQEDPTALATAPELLPPLDVRSGKKSNRKVPLVVGGLLATALLVGGALVLPGLLRQDPSPEPGAPGAEPADPTTKPPAPPPVAPPATVIPKPSTEWASEFDPPGEQAIDLEVGNISQEAIEAMDLIVNDLEDARGPDKADEPFMVGPVKVTGRYGLPGGQARNANGQSGGRRSLGPGTTTHSTWAYASVLESDGRVNFVQFDFSVPDGAGRIRAAGVCWIGRNNTCGDPSLVARVTFADGTTLTTDPVSIDGDGNGSPSEKNVFAGFEDQENRGGIVRLEVFSTIACQSYHSFQGWDELGIVLAP